MTKQINYVGFGMTDMLSAETRDGKKCLVMRSKWEESNADPEKTVGIFHRDGKAWKSRVRGYMLAYKVRDLNYVDGFINHWFTEYTIAKRTLLEAATA